MFLYRYALEIVKCKDKIFSIAESGLNYHIHFAFFPAEIKNGREVKPPRWLVVIDEPKVSFKTTYEINGHTGEFTKERIEILYDE